MLLGIAARHSERSGAKSRNPVALPQASITGSLDFARDDAGGRHGAVFRRNPYNIDGRSLFYAPSIGTDPGFADIIVEQAEKAAGI